MTQLELESLCAKWQKILRLQDWDVKIRFVRHFDLDAGTEGLCSFGRSTKTASIKILDGNDYDHSSQWKLSTEETVVHELLHLHLAPFDKGFDDMQKQLEENAINSIAAAFISLSRSSS